MAIEHVTDLSILTEKLTDQRRPAVLGFFGDFSQVSLRVRPDFERFCEAHPELDAFIVDVGVTKDIHPRFGVSAVPTVVLLERGKVSQRVVGPSTPEAYAQQLLDQRPASAGARATDAKAAPRVTVFTTPSCSWCTRVKSYLSGHGVGYSEIDVAKDERAMQRMVARSGQMGVPQLDINGRMIVGFDKVKIDQLLGLGAGAP